MADPSATVTLGGVVLGALLVGAFDVAWYLKHKSDEKGAAAAKAEDDRNADMQARVRRQHEVCSLAKSWVRDLRNYEWDDEGKRAYEVQSKASDHKQACYDAWDRAKAAEKQPPPNVIRVIDELYAAEDKVLKEVQSGQNLTPSVDQLQDALGQFRATVKRDLGMQL